MPFAIAAATGSLRLVELLDRCDFRPFVAEDDGTTLVLRRPHTARDVGTRVIHLVLLSMMLGMLIACPFMAWQRYSRWGDPKGLFLLPLLMLACWLGVKLALFAIRLEAARRIVCRPREFLLEGRGALLRHRDHLRDVSGLEAHIKRTRVRNHVVRWMYLRIRAGGELRDVGYLELDTEPEPAREVAVQTAAALMAARLGVPLAMRDEEDRLLTPPPIPASVPAPR